MRPAHLPRLLLIFGRHTVDIGGRVLRSASLRFVSPPALSRESVSLPLPPSLSFSQAGRGGRYACSSFRRGYCGNNGDINIPRRGAFSPRCKNASPPPPPPPANILRGDNAPANPPPSAFFPPASSCTCPPSFSSILN